jgi:hypothetical protein
MIVFICIYIKDMSNGVYIYEWAKKRKFFGRTVNEVSHLLLDRGVLCIPESSNDDFIHEYSRGVLMGGRPSCIVEYKPRVFRMFYDLDIVMRDNKMAKMMSAGDFQENVKNIMHIICIATVFLFDVTKTSATICISNVPKKKEDEIKVGIHITFDNIFVTSPTALHIREKVLELLNVEENPFANSWDQIVDAAVFKGSGMRLPWAAKHDDLKRVYIPRMEYLLDSQESGIIETKLFPDDIIKSLASVKEVISKTCLRARGSLTKLRNPEIDIECSSPTHSGNFSHASLKEYSGAIGEIERLIPSQYEGNVTGVIKAEHVYMFRHSSRYCDNVGRNHKSSNTYFLVSKSGMRQCCYSRKDEDVGQKYCRCGDFRGENIKLPTSLIEELFPDEDEKKILPPPPMPSSSIENFLSIDSIVERARKKPVPKKKVSVKKQTYTHGSAIAKVFG